MAVKLHQPLDNRVLTLGESSISRGSVRSYAVRECSEEDSVLCRRHRRLAVDDGAWRINWSLPRYCI